MQPSFFRLIQKHLKGATMSIRNFRLLFALTAALTGSALAQTTTTTRTSDFSFPLVGLASTETIGVNLINLASNSSSGTAASCTGTVAFLNSAGTTIGTATTFTLAADAVTSATLPFSSSGLTSPRGLIRAVLTTTNTSDVPCALSFSLNTYDTATGVTHVFLTGSGPQSGPNPGH
jgi:hypothetical protein